jgi:hypothetical protein
MAGTITHSWNGTILTIESDSGVSSVDLKGPGGPMGPRGAQGPAGITIDADGTLNLTGIATEQYVQDYVEAKCYEGVDGAVYTPMVASDGTLSWTNDGGLPNPPTVNIMGPQGPEGKKGVDGTVEFNELTAEQLEMIRGPQGIQGPVGPEGPVGPKGQDGTVAFDDLTDAQREMIRGPQGIQGIQGETYVLTNADKEEIVTMTKQAVFSYDSSTGRLDITV